MQTPPSKPLPWYWLAASFQRAFAASVWTMRTASATEPPLPTLYSVPLGDRQSSGDRGPVGLWARGPVEGPWARGPPKPLSGLFSNSVTPKP